LVTNVAAAAAAAADGPEGSASAGLQAASAALRKQARVRVRGIASCEQAHNMSAFTRVHMHHRRVWISSVARSAAAVTAVSRPVRACVRARLVGAWSSR
jgi:hypothetical protein